MESQIRDDRQMKAFTGSSQAPFDDLLPVFSNLSQATPHHPYAEGGKAGTRTRTPGGGFKGTGPTMADTWLFVLSDYKTSPTCDGLGTPCELVRAPAHENLHQFSPIFYDTLVPCDLMPCRERCRSRHH